ncbi:hypothetical protein GCM10023321_40880 [Pseudonocardia eucalypti]|uniref:Trypsin-like peptidase n=1 Tax=Pseudonocardia eucalypti TaxID=648755 RepID=A0ABP9QCF5_9PSEU|nr:V8-like Glu-specific endopeptidase [Pseudonocardia eucalypti]
MNPSSRRLRRSVLPVRDSRDTVGTATVIAPGFALTALHVIIMGNPRALTVGYHPRLPVSGVRTLALTEYTGVHEHARRSQQRAQRMVWNDTDHALATVDLALLELRGLHNPPLRPRPTPVHTGEHLVVAGYPGGHWSINKGPVTGTDDADFALRMLLGPGASGAPAIDHSNQLAGIVTLDHELATICIGPRLLATFLHQLHAVPS